jgi:hypothetical protein
MKPFKLTEEQFAECFGHPAKNQIDDLAQELEIYEMDPDSTLTLYASDVACPVHYCNATPGNPCVNMKGKPVAYHPARYVARGEENRRELTPAEKVLLGALK